MQLLEIVLLVALVLGTVWVVVALSRQGHPENALDRDLSEGQGPTGEQYPTGSGPAGPGAERMTPEPPEDTEDRSR